MDHEKEANQLTATVKFLEDAGVFFNHTKKEMILPEKSFDELTIREKEAWQWMAENYNYRMIVD